LKCPTNPHFGTVDQDRKTTALQDGADLFARICPLARTRLPSRIASLRAVRQPITSALAITAEDLAPAWTLLETAMPVLLGGARTGKVVGGTVMNYLKADYQTYVRPAIERRRRPTCLFAETLATNAAWSRTAMYDQLPDLVPQAEACAIALVMLLDLRQDFLGHRIWQLCELDSHVGRGAKGPGIPEHGQFQRLFGLMLGGLDMHLPALVETPASRQLDSAGAARQISSLIKRLGDTQTALARSASAVRPEALQELETTTQGLMRYRAPADLLVPRLLIGADRGAGRFTALGPEPSDVPQILAQANLKRAVVEVDHEPYRGSLPWIDEILLNEYFGEAVGVRLDVSFRAASASYALTGDLQKSPVLHRHQHEDDRQGASARAGDMSFALVGFGLAADCERTLDESLAAAIAYAEFMATSTHPSECAQRFGAALAPSYIKSHDDLPRRFVRALRVISNSALASVARKRQHFERELQGPTLAGPIEQISED
jgi:hypothetical protein